MVDLDAVTRGNRLELARLLTEVENQTPAGEQALDRLFARAGKAHLVGITGAPGTGKSSLVSCLAKNIRVAQKQTVAIVAVDPSSPFTGGAILGDRVRMRELAGDPGVFIRSMASPASWAAWRAPPLAWCRCWTQRGLISSLSKPWEPGKAR